MYRNRILKEAGKAVGKTVIKHEFKEKIHEKTLDAMTSHTSSVATAGFIAGAGAAQIDYNQLYRPSSEEVPEVFRDIHAEAFPSQEQPVSVEDVVDSSESLLYEIFSLFFSLF